MKEYFLLFTINIVKILMNISHMHYNNIRILLLVVEIKEKRKEKKNLKLNGEKKSQRKRRVLEENLISQDCTQIKQMMRF